MLVPGYQHQTWQCSACLEVEHRFAFTREKTVPEEVPIQPTHPEPPQANTPASTQTDVEERGATTSNSEQAAHPLQSAPALAPVEPQPATASDEPYVPASAWGRAVAKLRSWQTEKGGRQGKTST